MSQQQTPDQQEQVEASDPEDQFMQALIVLALLSCLATITLIVFELNEEYGVEFGGMMSAPDQVEQTEESP